MSGRVIDLARVRAERCDFRGDLIDAEFAIPEPPLPGPWVAQIRQAQPKRRRRIDWHEAGACAAFLTMIGVGVLAWIMTP